MTKNKLIIGVDEVGRGPLAGRVYVGCVCLNFDVNRKLLKLYKSHDIRYTRYGFPSKLADSKRLSEKQRHEWFSWIKKNKIIYSCAWVSEKKIDKLNISNACNLAAQKAFEKIIKKFIKQNVLVVADGSLKVDIQKYKNKNIRFKNFPKADEKVPAVSLASIVAKITRDKYITKLHKKYPHYGFDHHKGYGTKKHIEAIKKHGPSKIHRKSFLKNFSS